MLKSGKRHYLVGALLISLGIHAGRSQTTTELLSTRIIDPETTSSSIAGFLTSRLVPETLPATQSDWEARALLLRDSLRQLVGEIPFRRRDQPHVEPRGILQGNGYRVEKYLFEVMEGFDIPLNLYIPDSVVGQVPLILNPNGFFAEGKSQEWIQRRCIQFTRMGFVALSWDFIHTGERGGWNGFGSWWNSLHHSIWWRLGGVNSLAFTIAELRAIVDFASTLSFVDSSRIACVGASQGAFTSLLATAVDSRISLAVAVIPPTPFRTLPHETLGRFLEGPTSVWEGGFINSFFTQMGDVGSLVALAAPRPVKIITGMSDVASPSTVEEELSLARRVYSLSGTGERLSHDSVAGGHQYTLEARNSTYSWISRWFGSDSSITNELSTTLWPPDSLVCGVNPNRETVLSSGYNLIRNIVKAPVSPASGQAADSMRSAMRNDFVKSIGSASDSITGFDGLVGVSGTTEHISGRLFHENGLQTPLIICRTVNTLPTAAVLLLADSGKGFVDPLLVDSLTDCGYLVIIPDLFDTGELRFARFSQRVTSLYLEMSGSTTIAVGVTQLENILDKLEQEWGVRRAALVAEGGYSQVVVSLLADHSLVHATIVNNGLDGYQYVMPGAFPNPVPPRMQFKGSFLADDTHSLAALLAPKPSRISAMRSLSGGVVASSATARTLGDFYRAYRQEHLFTASSDTSGQSGQTVGWLREYFPPDRSISVVRKPDSLGIEDSLYYGRILTNTPRPVRFEILEGPSWLGVDSVTGEISGIAAAHSGESIPVGILMTTGSGDSLRYDYGLRIAHVNHAPVFTLLPDTVAVEDTVYAARIEAIDPDTPLFLDRVFMRMVNSPSWLSIDSTTGMLEGTPRIGDLPGGQVVIEAFDDSGAVTTHEFFLRVRHTNHPPALVSERHIVTYEDSMLSYTLAADDVDSVLGDSVVVTILDLPEWLSVDSTGMLLTGIPRGHDVGSSFVVVSLRDRDSAAVVDSVHVEIVHVNHPPAFVSSPRTDALEDSLYVYHIYATDQDSALFGDKLTFYFMEQPRWLSIDSISGVLSGVPRIFDLGDTDVNVAVRDDSGAVAFQSFTIDIQHVNHHPVFVSVPRTESQEDSLYEYHYLVSDPDTLVGDEYTVSLMTAPLWIRLDTESGILFGVPGALDVGPHGIRLRAEDKVGATSEQEFTITVAHTNHTPVFTSTPDVIAFEDSLYSYHAFATDQDSLLFGDRVVYALRKGPHWMNLDSISGVLSGVPRAGDVGESEIEIVGKDMSGAVATQVFELRIIHSNHDPVIHSVPLDRAQEDSLYAYQITATDPDRAAYGDSLLYFLERGPRWVQLDSVSGLLSGIPASEDVGESDVTIRVTDGLGGAAYQNFLLFVEHTNHAPVIVSSPVTFAVEDSLYEYQVRAYDPDSPLFGDVVRYALTIAPGWLAVDSISGLISGLPSGTAAQDTIIEVMVFDRPGSHFPLANRKENFTVGTVYTEGLAAVQRYRLTVRNVNHPPAIVSQPETVATVGSRYYYHLVVSDQDSGHTSHAITLLYDEGPSSFTFDTLKGVLKGTPRYDDIGRHRVLLSVADNAGAKASQEFELAIKVQNTAPTIVSIPDSIYYSGSTYHYRVVALDPDTMFGDYLRFRIITGPDWLNIDSTTGVISARTLSIHPDNVSEHVRVGVMDRMGEGASQEFMLTKATSVSANEHELIPVEYYLKQNYPNPFNPETSIQYGLAEVSSVRMRVYSILGEVVWEKWLSAQEAGHHATAWGITRGRVSAASSVYFLRVEVRSLQSARQFARTIKMIVLH